jgi:hypothetical protein
MSSYQDDYVDGNAAAGALNMLFTMDVTTAEGQCASCGATKCFAEARVYLEGPGVVARCSECENVLLRFTHAGTRVLIDMRGLQYVLFDTTDIDER